MDTTIDQILDATKDIVQDLTADLVNQGADTQAMTLFDLSKSGGWAMWPLLFFSIATLAIFIERALTIFVHNKLSIKETQKEILVLVQKNKMKEAVEYCKQCDPLLIGVPILQAGIEMETMGEHRMERAIETAANEKINLLERGFNLLIALGSIAPITGFLGTVSGMINAFRSIANAADVNAQLVAGGIFEALITTAYGLAIAIIAIAGYNIFAHFVDKFIADIEQAGSELITAILLKDKKNNKEMGFLK